MAFGHRQRWGVAVFVDGQLRAVFGRYGRYRAHAVARGCEVVTDGDVMRRVVRRSARGTIAWGLQDVRHVPDEGRPWAWPWSRTRVERTVVRLMPVGAAGRVD